MPNICLNMIVKNEAHVIERCLASVKPWVTRWLIVDTGSTDGTQDVIRRFMQGVPGALHERPWRNFGHNRNEALELARGEADYLLFIDADEVLHVPSGFAWPVLQHEAFGFDCRYNETRYQRNTLVATRLPWHWEGVIHEFLTSEVAHTWQRLPGPEIWVNHDGARAHDPQTYLRDIALLEAALKDEPGNARYAFYLAQSYNDSGQLAASRERYLLRATMGGWEEERWTAQFRAAQLAERLQLPPALVRSEFLSAYQARPSRAEPLYELARFHRERQEHYLALLFAQQAATVKLPADTLFVIASVYQWRAIDELAVAASWCVEHRDGPGRRAMQQLVENQLYPASEAARIEGNRIFYGVDPAPRSVITPLTPSVKNEIHISSQTQPTPPDSLCSIFSAIYEHDVWDGGSGPGSRLENIQPYAQFLRSFLNEHGIQSVVDCGCGDWQSTRYLDWTGIAYTGIDIVPTVVEANQNQFATQTVRFICDNFCTMDLPSADLAICKDALQHLPDAQVQKFLQQLYKFRYVLITNDLGDNQSRDSVLIANPYHFARLDVTLPPFSLPASVVCEFPGSKVTHLFSSGKLPTAQRMPHSPPRVLMAILAKQKEATLPLYLRCIEALDYPKSQIDLYIRTNNNTDQTEPLLRDWVQRVGSAYRSVEFDADDVEERVQQFGIHEWNSVRFKVLGAIRQHSMELTAQKGCDFYFVVDVDNFILPHTLRALVELDLPIVGPLLRHQDADNRYSNFHHEVDGNGYFIDSPQYTLLLNQTIRSVTPVKAIHCTYLVRADAIGSLKYDDQSGRHEYVIFSTSARAAGIPQYLDTRDTYGYLTLDEQCVRSAALLQAALERAMAPAS